MSESAPIQVEGYHRAMGRNVLLKVLAASSLVFQAAFFVAIARRFGAGALGDLTVLLMIGSVVGLVFGDLGVNTTMVARMNGCKGANREKIASTGLFWKIVLSALSFVLMLAAMRLGVHFGTWPELLSVSLISLCSLWLAFLSSLTNGVNRLGAEAWLTALFRVTVYGAGFAVCFFGGIELTLAYMAVAGVVVLAASFHLLCRKVVPVGFPWQVGIVGGFLKESIPVWVTQVAQLTYLKLDMVILGVLHVAARETGWYAAAWKLTDVLTAVPSLLAGAVLPLISGALPGENASTMTPNYLKAMYVLPYFLVLPLVTGADWITQLLYGKAFTGTPEVLRVLVWALVPISIHTFLATVAVATGRQSEAARLGAVAAVLGLVAAAVLVPRFGYQSMAVISLVVNSLFACAMVYQFRDLAGSTRFVVGVKALLGALAVFWASALLAGHVPAPLGALASPCAYGLSLFLLGVVTVRDVNRGWRIVGSLFLTRTAGSGEPA